LFIKNHIALATKPWQTNSPSWNTQFKLQSCFNRPLDLSAVLQISKKRFFPEVRGQPTNESQHLNISLPLFSKHHP